MLRFFNYLLLNSLLFFSISGLSAQTGKTSVLIRNHIQSKTLQERREYCLYLPENFNPRLQYPVIFAADGQMIREGRYKNLLDSLMTNNIIPPSILIGIYSNEQETSSEEGQTLRYYEYAYRDKRNKIRCNRYDRHSDFFLEEIRDSVFTAYGIQPDPHYLIFYGCSNGGDYGMRLLHEHPEKFTHFLCYSPIATTGKKIFRNSRDRVYLYLSYGSEELQSPFGLNLVQLDQTVQKHKDPRVSAHIYQGGHKRAAWEKEFADRLPLVFGKK